MSQKESSYWWSRQQSRYTSLKVRIMHLSSRRSKINFLFSAPFFLSIPLFRISFESGDVSILQLSHAYKCVQFSNKHQTTTNNQQWCAIRSNRKVECILICLLYAEEHKMRVCLSVFEWIAMILGSAHPGYGYYIEKVSPKIRYENRFCMCDTQQSSQGFSCKTLNL